MGKFNSCHSKVMYDIVIKLYIDPIAQFNFGVEEDIFSDNYQKQNMQYVFIIWEEILCSTVWSFYTM